MDAPTRSEVVADLQAGQQDRRLCSVEGCARLHSANGYCAAHVQQIRRHGTISNAALRPYRKRDETDPPRCTVETCDRPAATRYYCASHYTRVLRHGDPQAHIPLRPYRKQEGS
jgi:hypothetical protein